MRQCSQQRSWWTTREQPGIDAASQRYVARDLGDNRCTCNGLDIARAERSPPFSDENDASRIDVQIARRAERQIAAPQDEQPLPGPPEQVALEWGCCRSRVDKHGCSLPGERNGGLARVGGGLAGTSWYNPQVGRCLYRNAMKRIGGAAGGGRPVEDAGPLGLSETE